MRHYLPYLLGVMVGLALGNKHPIAVFLGAVIGFLFVFLYDTYEDHKENKELKRRKLSDAFYHAIFAQRLPIKAKDTASEAGIRLDVVEGFYDSEKPLSCTKEEQQWYIDKIAKTFNINPLSFTDISVPIGFYEDKDLPSIEEMQKIDRERCKNGDYQEFEERIVYFGKVEASVEKIEVAMHAEN